MKEVTKLEEIEKTNSLVKIGTGFCGPCKLVEENLKQLEPEYPDLKIYLVDAEEAEDLVTELGIRNVPTLILYKSGVEVGRRVGMATIEQLKEFIGGE
jgi:thioredoxin 1